MIKKIVLILIASLAIGSLANLSFAGEIKWGNSLSEALNTAKSQNKPVMVDFYTDWCGWCKKLDSDTYSNSKVQALADKFVCVKVNGDKDKANTSKYGISGYPTIVFLDSTGKEIDKNVGYAGPEDMAQKMEKLVK
jgi:thiol:disulfide interchange protein